jgi:hypothetical protein
MLQKQPALPPRQGTLPPLAVKEPAKRTKKLQEFHEFSLCWGWLLVIAARSTLRSDDRHELRELRLRGELHEQG